MNRDKNEIVNTKVSNTRNWAEEKTTKYIAGPEANRDVKAKVKGPAQKAFAFGTCLEHLYNHSWSCKTNRWVWVTKGNALVAADLGFGYPARREEIARFRGAAGRIYRVKSGGIDKRSFT